MLPGTINDWLAREWLLTNGCGGYASSTSIGCPTRRHHGWLTWTRLGLANRWILWAHTAEHVIVDGRTYLLGNFEFNNAIDPHGYQHLVSFDVYPAEPNPAVEWVYRLGGAEVRKLLWLQSGRDRVCVRYDVSAKSDVPVKLQVWPLIACREAGALRRKFAGNLFETTSDKRGFSLRYRLEPHASFAVAAHADGEGAGVHFIHRPDWWYNFKYRQEAARGLDWGEDLFVAGSMLAEGRGHLGLQILGDAETSDLRVAANECRALSVPVPTNPISAADADSLLAMAGRQCVVLSADCGEPAGQVIVAGYPWLESYSRDTCVAIPGLLLDQRRFDVARHTLIRIAGLLRGGLLPNHVVDDAAEHEYTAADEPLWLIYAVDALMAVFELDPDSRKQLLTACQQVIDAYRQGAGDDARMSGWIRMDPADGLIRCGREDSACTWMDARVGTRWITPRCGKPVEVNALWYHALRAMSCRLAGFDDRAAVEYAELADRVEQSFVESFWRPETGCLADVLTDGGPDDTLRPNQIIALGLPHSPIGPDMAARVLEVVSQKLLTPFGLRSLAPDHPAYRGRYEGSPTDREEAAHQGSVYPWLMGHYIAAWLRVHGTSPKSRATARALMGPLIDHLRGDAGLGGISELFDGDAPHTPRGCINQAWSVAEVARAWRMTDPATASSHLEDVPRARALSNAPVEPVEVAAPPSSAPTWRSS